MKGMLLKGLGAMALTTTIVGALTFNGGEILDLTKAKLNELTSSITQFNNNEVALKDKVTSLRSEITSLKEQIENGQGNEEELNARIKALETQLATLEGELTQQRQETEKANIEIEKANAKANEVQEVLNAHNEATKDKQPMTNEQLQAFLNGDSVTTPPTPPTSDKKVLKLVEGNTYSDDRVTITVKGNQLILNSLVPSANDEAPLWATINGGISFAIDLGANLPKDIKVGDILRVRTNNGINFLELHIEA